MSRPVRLGAGAGFAGDRLDPAVDLATHGALDFLVFECLGERTVAAGHVRRRNHAATGHDPLWETRLRAVLPACRRHGTRIVTNAGAANPVAAGEVAVRVAKEIGATGLRIAVVTGDEVLPQVLEQDPMLWETGARLGQMPQQPVSANAYLGAGPIREALDRGADVVITGRVADPSLYVGPLQHNFGWSDSDADITGKATVVGHLLECAGQLTGGYYADPVTKPVPDLARLGFPFADVRADGSAVLGKLPQSGGRLDPSTCAEQLLYEVEDPGAYLTPDVVADFSDVRFEQVGADRVRVTGASGRPAPSDLKVTLGFPGGWVGEGQISYAGPRALARAELAGDVVRERLATVHGVHDVEVELIGAGAAHRGLGAAVDAVEVRLRVAARVTDPDQAQLVGWEVESLYTNGPAGGGGARTSITETVAVRSCLLPRDLVRAHVEMVVV